MAANYSAATMPPSSVASSRSSPLEVAAPPDSPTGTVFETDARDVAQRLQTALAELVTRAAGRVRKAVELQQRLGIDKNLAWKVFRVISAENLLAEADKVPGWPTMQRLLEAAGDRGAPPEVIDRVTAAFEAFQNFVQEHAGDRDSFGVIAAALSPEQSDPFGVAYRKTLFQVQSQLLGRKTGVSCHCSVFSEPATPDSSPICEIFGQFDVRPLRRGITLRIGMGFCPDYEAAKPEFIQPELVMLPEFCSNNLPIPHLNANDKFLQNAVVLDDLGRNGSVDVAMYGISSTSTHDDFVNTLEHGTPCELVYHDRLVPVGLSDPSTVSARVYYGMTKPSESLLAQPKDLVPLREAATYRGRVKASTIVPITEAPRYAEMIRHVAGLIGVTDMEFDLYRYRIEYPILYSATVQSVDRVKSPPSPPTASGKAAGR